MASIQANENKVERGVLNTTIDKDVLEKFKDHCKASVFPMNTIIEAFMSQFAAGEFVLKIGKNNKLDIE